jgi:NAD(P)-dependent dehydrogenase (short-subunit alcohol dehydrogenase family)
MTDEDFDLVIRTHLRGTFTCARAAAIRMREQGAGGGIITVGSPTGQFGDFGQTNYATIASALRRWLIRSSSGCLRSKRRWIDGSRAPTSRIGSDIGLASKRVFVLRVSLR